MTFVTMAKPAGALCNMQCSYCYYLHTHGSADPKPVMSDETLELYIRTYIASVREDVISFTWHGGEPTMAGLDFYRKAMELQKKYLPKGKTCWNNLQTNGLALNDEWCAFLKENRFDVGVSIDGTRFVHDTHRHDTAGNPTYERIVSNIQKLMKAGIRPDLLCTVTEDTAQSGKAVYQALRKLNTGWIQFIPIVVIGEDGNLTEDSVTPQSYGRFLKTVFREWAKNDMGKINVQIIAETALALSGKPANVCWFAETCGNVLIVEKDGSVYSCDHYVDSEHCLGNIRNTDIGILAESEIQKTFGLAKKDTLAKQCLECPYLQICHGCCPKDRFLVNADGEKVFYLCEGLQMYFDYAVPVLKKAMELSSQGKTAAQIMKILGGAHGISG